MVRCSTRADLVCHTVDLFVSRTGSYVGIKNYTGIFSPRRGNNIKARPGRFGAVCPFRGASIGLFLQ